MRLIDIGRISKQLILKMKGSTKMDKKELKKAINQLGRVKKSSALDPIDKKTIERIRKKLYNKLEKNTKKEVKTMKRIAALSHRGDKSYRNTEIEFYDTKQDAIEAAESEWDHLTVYDKKRSTIEVVTIEKNNLDDPEDWASYHSYDTLKEYSL